MAILICVILQGMMVNDIVLEFFFVFPNITSTTWHVNSVTDFVLTFVVVEFLGIAWFCNLFFFFWFCVARYVGGFIVFLVIYNNFLRLPLCIHPPARLSNVMRIWVRLGTKQLSFVYSIFYIPRELLKQYWPTITNNNSRHLVPTHRIILYDFSSSIIISTEIIVHF